MFLNDLPLPLLKKIFSYLSIRDKFRCECVCRHWQRNIFSSVDALAFEYEDDDDNEDSTLKHKHLVSKKNLLSAKDNSNDEMLKSIIAKCGCHLRLFKGYVSNSTMKAINQHCDGLRCIDMRFRDYEALAFLFETYLRKQSRYRTCIGMQITCATVYDDTCYGMACIIHRCPYLSYLAILTLHAFYHIEDVIKLHEAMSSLSHLETLVIESNVTEKLLKTLSLLPKLRDVTIILDNDLHKSAEWNTLMNSNWSCLTSLSLRVDCEHSLPVSYKALPQSLERLDLLIINSKPTLNVGDLEKHDRSTIFRTFLPKLKTLNFYQRDIGIRHINPILLSIWHFFPNVEELSFSFQFYSREHEKGLSDDDDEDFYDSKNDVENLDGSVSDDDDFEDVDDFDDEDEFGDDFLDEYFEPLLSMTTLKRLTLGPEVGLTDDFYCKLFADLHQLASLGSPYCKGILPDGAQFWKNIVALAIRRPRERFSLTGEPLNPLLLSEILPQNVSLTLEGTCEVKLSNGFEKSDQWLQVMEESKKLVRLTIEMKNRNLNAVGLPQWAKVLTLNCLNGGKGKVSDALTFNTCLTNLSALRIYQESMSNQQLNATLLCISAHCPVLTNLCLGRGNKITEPVDEYVACLADCAQLKFLCHNEQLVFSPEFRAKWRKKGKRLTLFRPMFDFRHKTGNLDCGCFRNK